MDTGDKEGDGGQQMKGDNLMQRHNYLEVIIGSKEEIQQSPDG